MASNSERRKTPSPADLKAGGDRGFLKGPERDIFNLSTPLSAASQRQPGASPARLSWEWPAAVFVVGCVESQKCPKEGFQMQAAAFQLCLDVLHVLLFIRRTKSHALL